MQRNKPNLTENKLLMLYSINLLGGVTNTQAQRFFLENEFMDYIDVQLSLAELTENKLLCAAVEPLGMTYAITDFGRQALFFFKSHVPASRREAVDAVASRWHEIFTRETQVFADYVTALNGDIIVRLAARERGALMFEMNISVTTSSQAERLCKKWREQSSKIYCDIMDMLTSDEEPPVEGYSAENVAVKSATNH